MHQIGKNMNQLQQRIRGIMAMLKEQTVATRTVLDGFLYKEVGYKVGSDMPVIDDTFRPFYNTDRWGGEKPDTHAWFYKRVDFGDSPHRTELFAKTNLSGWDGTNPQFMLYIDGELKQGLDIHHTSAAIDERGMHDVYLYAYNRPFDVSPLTLEVSVLEINEDVERLYYNLSVACDALELSETHTHEYAKILHAINETFNRLDLCEVPSGAFYKSVRQANAYIEVEFYGKVCAPGDAKVACVGHTHIDVAWQWTVAQTREKAQHSFATVIALMDRYPEYKFTSSQAYLYKAVKEECPALYEKVKARIAEGRWEVEGGMWVEADCNLVSGESLVRQFLYGKRFFMREFGVASRVLWLPDVFGYAASLPQIMKKCGVDDFVTSKISWNESNMMPYDCFTWRGIDGTEVLTHFITAQNALYGVASETTYVSTAEPKMIAGAYNRYQQKFIHTETLATVGRGDGGGGTTVYDIEAMRRLEKGLPNVPTATFKSGREYIDGVHESVDGNKHLPLWQGELYLELHRGTYTSQANNKKNNRKGEFLLQTAETVGVLGEILLGGGYDRDGLCAQWETVLLNQFHDIIPGSSIRPVYEQTDREYAELFTFGETQIHGVLEKLAKKSSRAGILVFNPNSFPYSGTVAVDGKRYAVDGIPAKGYKVVEARETVSAVQVTEGAIENAFFKVAFDEKMNIISVFDKTACREILKPGRAIRYRLYEDLPDNWDAWEINRAYREKSYDVDDVVSVEKVVEADRAGYRVTRAFGKTTITDTVYLYDREKRIEFSDEIDWQAKHVLLKREFPLDIVTDTATCEIPFGSIERPVHANTSWDAAKFEVCAQKYIDVSESDYGVALLNDCKFGHSVQNCDIGISLLRAPTHPDPQCDIGRHTMTYALYPHKGAARASDVAAEAYRFNNPCYAVMAAGKGSGLSEYSLLSCASPHVFIDMIKLAEDSDDIVIRLYEASCTRGTATLHFGFPVKEAYLCDMMENDLTPIAVADNAVTLDYKPFEILSLKLKR